MTFCARPTGSQWVEQLIWGHVSQVSLLHRLWLIIACYIHSSSIIELGNPKVWGRPRLFEAPASCRYLSGSHPVLDGSLGCMEGPGSTWVHAPISMEGVPSASDHGTSNSRCSAQQLLLGCISFGFRSSAFWPPFWVYAQPGLGLSWVAKLSQKTRQHGLPWSSQR